MKTKNQFNSFYKYLTVSLINIFVLVSSNTYSQGPNAPEAAAFEPVDATDMVNLLTGDMSYVMPVINVPSPEGGYPLTLSYHAGIAMDQEASWVGLGWNINPGTINRSVQGYPDDWKSGFFTEYYYDVGVNENNSYFSINYTDLTTGGSVGAKFAWGSNRSFGGDVNFSAGGLSASIGTSGVNVGLGGSIASINIGVSSTGDINFGVSARAGILRMNALYSNGQLNMNASVGIQLGSLSGSYSITGGDFSVSAKSGSMSVSYSSNGSWSVKGLGTGFNSHFSKSITLNDYNIKESSWSVPYIIPIPWTGGAVHGSFGNQKYSANLSKSEKTTMQGALYFNEKFGNWVCKYKEGILSPQEEHMVDSQFHKHSNTFLYSVSYVETENTEETTGYIMDMYEIATNINGNSGIHKNNAGFANYDDYHVTAQGMGGSITPRYYEAGGLIGLSKDFRSGTNVTYDLKYQLSTFNDDYHNLTSFNKKPIFYFENEYATNAIKDPIQFSKDLNATSIFDNITNFQQETTIERRKISRYIETFTWNDISSTNSSSQGFLKPNNTDFFFGTNDDYDSDGIIGFKITAPDGKTYHYSLPVYNHEVVSRQFGHVEERPLETQAFYEKRQLKKFATHWLLTAITGPDFIDNGDNAAGNGDLGFWVSFDYGKWSDGYVWRTPKNDSGYNLNYENSNIKNYTWGRKDIYYLDKIKTRSHTALFVKSLRDDNQGNSLTYNGRLDRNTTTTFKLKGQKLLKLDKILLIKNDKLERLGLSKMNKEDIVHDANTTKTLKWFEEHRTAKYNLQDNILDIKDLLESEWNSLQAQSFRTISFNYDYSLAKNAPYSENGRLALKNLTFRGRNNLNLLPSYKFGYIKRGNYDESAIDEWGYDVRNPANWSLNHITNPTGGTIEIDYESDEYSPVLGTTVVYNSVNDINNIKHINNDTFQINSNFANHFINVNNEYEVYEIYPLIVGVPPVFTKHLLLSNKSLAYLGDRVRKVGNAKINSKLGNTLFSLSVKYDPGYGNYDYENDFKGIALVHTHKGVNEPEIEPIKGGGLRVKKVSTSNNITSQSVGYSYKQNDKNSGWTSYVPRLNSFFPQEGLVLPFFNPTLSNLVSQNLKIEDGFLTSLLPAPNVLYEKVESQGFDDNENIIGTNEYEFYVMKNCSLNENSIAFENYLKIESSNDQGFANSFVNNQGIIVNTSDFKIIENFALIGQLKKITNFNQKGQIISQTENSYKNIEDISKGVDQESFQNYKIVDLKDNQTRKDIWLINNTTKTKYPSVLESTTVNEGGFSSTTYFDKHDDISGQLLETLTESSDGTKFKTKVIPAYRIPDYSDNLDGYGMGSKVDNITNKNMLAQTAATLTQIKDGTGNWKTINADITTWNNDWQYRRFDGSLEPAATSDEKIWRKHKSFAWKGEVDNDGAYMGYTGDDNGFNWSDPDAQTDSKWINTSTISKYDHYSMPLESIDINDNRASTKMGDDNTKIFAVANAGYNEMFYSGAEDLIEGTNYFSGEVSKGTTAILSDTYHTGAKGIEVTANVKSFIVKPDAGNYKVSVWAYKGANNNYTNTKLKVGAAVVAYNDVEVIPAGDWVQLNFYTGDVAANQEIYVYTSSGTVIYDDFRLLPIESSMTSYVYNEWDELTYIIGANSLATHYRYDEAGRLTCTFTEVIDTPKVKGGFKLINSNVYKYKGGTASTPCNTVSDAGLNLSLSFYENGSSFYVPYTPNIIINVLNGTKNVRKWELDLGDGTAIIERTGPIDDFLINHPYSPGEYTITLKAVNESNQIEITTKTFEYIQYGVCLTNVVNNFDSRPTTFTIKGAPGNRVSFESTSLNSGQLTIGTEVFNINKNQILNESFIIPSTGTVTGELLHNRSTNPGADYEYTDFAIKSASIGEIKVGASEIRDNHQN